MADLPTPADVAMWLRQCKAWANELADLERWPPELRADILDRLRRAPAVSLQAQAEHFRGRINEARERAGVQPTFEHENRPTPSPLPVKPRWRREWESKKATEIFRTRRTGGTDNEHSPHSR